MPWNPDQYQKFQNERSALFEDLFALIRVRPNLQVIGLGCGAGELTARLAERLAILNKLLLFSRHMLAILLMPFFVVVIVPNWLLDTFVRDDSRWGTGLYLAWLPRSAGTALVLLGLILFAWCVSLFMIVGKGTLAPWDPAQNLVGVGPYRYVRNPMISGVALMLIGQALFWGSWVLGFWVCMFILINHIYFVLSEEPGLERRFQEKYCVYKENVPRWIPRIKPWQGT